LGQVNSARCAGCLNVDLHPPHCVVANCVVEEDDVEVVEVVEGGEGVGEEEGGGVGGADLIFGSAKSFASLIRFTKFGFLFTAGDCNILL